MLTFQQITLNTVVPYFQQSHQKFIRFSFNTVSSVSPEHGLVMQDNKIRWNKNFTFPAAYGKEIAFEVFERHRFGYNPEEFNVIKGSFVLSKGQTFKQVDVTDSNGSKLGKIQFKLRSNSIIPVKIQKIMPKNQKLIIKSLTAHIKSLSGKKSYISIKLGDIHKQTSVAKSHGGQIVYTEPIEMEKSSFVNKALIEIFFLEDKGNQVKTVGNGILEIGEGMVQRCVMVKDEKDAEVGKLFVNGRLIEKGKMNFEKKRQSRYSTVDVFKHSSVNPQKYSTINIQRLNSFRQPPTQQSRISSFRGGLSVQLPRNSSQSSSNLMSSSQLSVSRMKKMTILNDNKQIVFPKQQRFKLYQDHQSPFISYLNERDDFSYKQKHSGRFYRGVAMGYGDKTDFAQKGSPGVGRYKLPSIWDKY